MDMTRIGSRLKRLRQEKGLTQEQLAEKLYVSVRTVSRWECGSNLPDTDTLLKLSEFYGTDIGELINGESSGQPAYESSGETAAVTRKRGRGRLFLLISCFVTAVLVLTFVTLKIRYRKNVIEPMSKAVYAEFDHGSEGEFGGRTFYKQVDMGGQSAVLSMKVPSGSSFSAVYVLKTDKPAAYDGKEYDIQVMYSINMYPTDDHYFVSLASDGDGMSIARGFELDESGELLSREKKAASDEELRLLKELSQYYVPMLERVKSEAEHIFDLY